MSRLYLPDRFIKEAQKAKHLETRAERKALLEMLMDFDDPACREWGPVLADLDPYLRIGRAKPSAWAPGMNVKAGFYHWVRDNPTAPVSIDPITAPDGESFALPSSRLLDELKACDLQNPRVWQEVINRHAEQEAEKERAEADRVAEMNARVEDRYKTLTSGSLGWRAPGKWSQNSNGSRGAKPA